MMDLDKALWIYKELVSESTISQQLTRQEIEQAVKALGDKVKELSKPSGIEIAHGIIEDDLPIGKLLILGLGNLNE